MNDISNLQLADHLEEIQGSNEHDVLYHAINYLEIKTLEDISKVEITSIGYRNFETGEIHKSKEEMKSYGDEVFSIKFNENGYDIADQFEAESMETLKHFTTNAIKAFPQIKNIDIQEFDSEKLEKVVREIHKNSEKVDFYNEVKKKIKPKAETKPIQKIKI